MKKLTKEDIVEYAAKYNLIGIWNAIEADREAIREEALKDHFRIGEAAMVSQTGQHGIVSLRLVLANGNGAYTYCDNPMKVQHVTKTRPMTREEMWAKFHNEGSLFHLTDVQIKKVLEALGLDAEVDQ